MEIKIYKYPKDTKDLLIRDFDPNLIGEAVSAISDIINDIEENGDTALLKYERQFDCPSIESLKVTEQEFEEAEAAVSQELKDAMKVAADNIRKFHAAQLMEPIEVETTPGVVCRQKAVPLHSVGLYVPGGRAPLFSTALMLAIPARLAGCPEIAICTPPDKSGRVNPTILVAARLAGVTKVYKAGGAQAIAAMAFGTETIPKVNKIFGPGNLYVMLAKAFVAKQTHTLVDLPAGPSEVMIVADETANPTFVAADFLSQAEHGPDSQSILVTTSERLADEVAKNAVEMAKELPRVDLIEQSLKKSHIIVVRTDNEMMRIANEYAPEHLIINHADADRLAEMVENAGSVFLGQYACESAGDYASGTNHTLPTSGNATAYSGVNIDSFMKKITFQRLTAEGIATLGPVVETMAEGEGLLAHKLAATVRIEQVKKR